MINIDWLENYSIYNQGSPQQKAEMERFEGKSGEYKKTKDCRWAHPSIVRNPAGSLFASQQEV